MTEQPDPRVYALSMIEKIKDPQIRATLGYMLGMMTSIEMKMDAISRELSDAMAGIGK